MLYIWICQFICSNLEPFLLIQTEPSNHTDAYIQLQTQIVAALEALAAFPGFRQRNAQRHMIGDIARTMMTSGLEHPIMAIVCP